MLLIYKFNEKLINDMFCSIIALNSLAEKPLAIS